MNIMENACFVNDCKNDLEFICMCDMTLACSSHLGQHLISNKPHKPMQINWKINEDTHNYVIGSLMAHYQCCEMLESKITSESKLLMGEIHKIMNLNLTKIKELKKTIFQYISFLNSKSQPKNSSQDYFYNLIRQSKENAQKKINLDWKNFTITSNTRKILSDLSNLFKIDYIKTPYVIREEKYLYFFADMTKTLVSFNVKKKNIQNFSLYLDNVKGHAGSFCYMEDLKVFYGGGSLNSKCLSEYVIIDTREGFITTIKKGRSRKQGGSCYISPYIYIFGGCEPTRAIKSCDKYNTKTQKWEVFNELPVASDTTSVIFQDKILVTGGKLSSVYYYDHANDTYHETLRNLPFGNKFLCCGNGKVYLLCNNLIYSSHLGNYWKWTLVKEFAGLGNYWISCWTRYKDSVYYTTGHYHFFDELWPKATRFNLDTLEITDIV
jgi:Kelch motif